MMWDPLFILGVIGRLYISDQLITNRSMLYSTKIKVLAVLTICSVFCLKRVFWDTLYKKKTLLFPELDLFPRSRKSVPVSLLILGSVGLTRLSFLYVRCREEDGPDCVLTQYHKEPLLSHLPSQNCQLKPQRDDLNKGTLWRYFK